MPNRVIKESVWTSPNLNKVDPLAERHFYRLLLCADDFGCCECSPLIVKGKCYPLQLTTKPEDIDFWQFELEKQGLLFRWSRDGRQYAIFPTFAKHQRVRSLHQRKTPAPPSDVENLCRQQLTLDDICQRPQADDKTRQQTLADDRLNPNPNPNPNPNTLKGKEPVFAPTEKETDSELEQSVKQLRKYPETNIPLVKQVFAGLKTRRGYNSPKPSAEAVAINEMLKTYQPDQILKAWDIMKKDEFWQGKELFVMSVKTQIGAILKDNAEKGETGNVGQQRKVKIER